MKTFLRELKRRKVYQVGVVYVVVGYGVAEGAQYLFELAGLPVVASRAVAIMLLLGLPVALVLAWAYELRPDDSPQRDGRPPPEGTASVIGDVNPPDRGASIAVLPFDNISPDPSDAYFADGLTEEITASLCGVRDLRMISRNSATVSKKAGKDTHAIGVDLGVAFVLEGSVRKAGDALRVTAQLIRADTDEHLWSERYDGAMSDVFGVQEEVARSIVRTLELHLRPEEDRRLAARPMDDVLAYESYLKAREASLKWTPEALAYALEHLLEAHARVGENAVVQAGIGYVFSQFLNMGANDRDYGALAEEHAQRALQLDPDNPEAHMVLGFLNQLHGDFDRSLHHLERSLALKPDDPHTLMWRALSLFVVGRNEEMEAVARRLVEVDPLTPLSRSVLGLARQVQGDLRGGLEEMRVAHRGSAEGSSESFFYAHALAMVGQGDDALVLLRREFALETQGQFAFLAHLLRAALEEDPEGVEAVMTPEVRVQIARDVVLALYTTGIHALAGLRAGAYEGLRQMVEAGFRNHPWLTHDPWIAAYRDDPEFRPLFEEVRDAWMRSAGDREADARP